ncbi:gamma-glutamylcyclotransferase family protein [Francisella halioticida]|uniref:gamma-glutamylcyclotransferase family protein n=1 Tax=Francisella halioticida TaxID=549298 RepID=UPI0030B80D3E
MLDKGIVKVSGKRFHPVLKEICREEDKVYGTIFEITSKELRCSDEYEVGSYIRKEVTLTSGKKAWIYTEKSSN